MEKEGHLFSIGYGLRSPDSFLSLVKQYGINYIADVRSNPYSKWNPNFCREPIAAFLQDHGVGYVYIGDMIGGIPKDSACYTLEGKLDYALVKQHSSFQKGIERLLKATEKKLSVALMCGEVEPHTCHRSKLIGEVLAERGIPLHHILSDHLVKSQAEVMLELTKGRNTTDLFGQTLF